MPDLTPGEATTVAAQVLLVDDHRMVAETLSARLAEEVDITVVGVASNGADALAQVGRHAPDVVVVDYHMPDRDGVSIAAEIRDLAPATRVVMLTASNDDRVLLDAIEAGCAAFVTKDQPACAVVDAIRAAAAGEALISPQMLVRVLPRLHGSSHTIGGDLTAREGEILHLLAEGLSTKTIATRLHLSVNTIRNYVQSILTKLQAHSRLEAVATAVREGIIDHPASPAAYASQPLPAVQMHPRSR